jgi:hypothetical protein
MNQSNNLSEVHNQLMTQFPEGSTAKKVAEMFNVSESTVKRAAEFANAVDVISENVLNIDREVRSKILSGDIDMSIKEIIALAQEDVAKQQRRISQALAEINAGTKAKKPEKQEKSRDEKIAARFKIVLKEMEYFTNEQLDFISAEVARIKGGRKVPDDFFEAPVAKPPQEKTSPELNVPEEPQPQEEQTQTAEPSVSEESPATKDEIESEGVSHSES